MQGKVISLTNMRGDTGARSGPPAGPPVPRGSKILLLLPPFYTPYTPPLGISVLKAFIEARGYQVTCLDFNTIPHIWVAHHRYFELLQKLEGLSHQHGYTNLWYILQAHMMAHLNGVGSTECAALLAEILSVYDLKASPEVINGLIPIVGRLFRDIDAVLTNDIDLASFAVVGTSTYSTSLGPSLHILRRAKERFPNLMTVMGGGVFADDLAVGSDNLDTLIREFGFVDHIVMGEGEILFRDLLDGRLRSERVLTREHLAGAALDVHDLKMPDYTDFQLPNYLHLCIEGARSCPFQCHFCSETVQWGGYRKKPAGVLAGQMINLADTHGNRTFFMGDSLMNPYIEDLSTTLLEKGAHILYDGYLRADRMATYRSHVERWAKSGCVRARLGIESGSAKILNAMKKETTPENISKVIKTLASAGIRVTTLWIVGFPGETEQDFQETLDFIRQHHRYIYELDVHYYYYYPYGQVWSRLHKSTSLYSKKVVDAIKFQQWEIVDCDPPRSVKFERLRRINDLATELGIPNLHTLQARYQAEARWQLSFPLAVEFFEGTFAPRGMYETAAGDSGEPLPLPVAATCDNRSPLTFVVRVAQPLDVQVLGQAAHALVAYNEVLQAEVGQHGLVVTAAPSLDPTAMVVRTCPPGLAAETLQALEPGIWAGMAPRPGKSLRILAIDEGDNWLLALSVHRAIGDSRTVALLLEDLFRLYEQFSHGRVVALRPCETSYRDALRSLSAAAGPAGPAAIAPSSGRPPQPRATARFALNQELTRQLTPAVLQRCGASLAELLYAGISRSLVGEGVGLIECRADLRLLRRDLAQTCGALHVTTAVPADRRAPTALDDVRRSLERLRDSLTRPPAGGDITLAIDLELATAEPWLGGDAWTPAGFLDRPDAPHTCPLFVRVAMHEGRIAVSVDYADSEAATVERWRLAEERGHDTFWNQILAEIAGRADTTASAPTRVRRFEKRQRQRLHLSDGLVELGALEGAADRFPLVIQPATPDLDAVQWASAHRGRVEELLDAHGALLFRGFAIPTEDAFRRFGSALSDELLEFSERAAPRVEVARRVYTSTEYPSEYPIPLHHENAFAYKWPMKVFFHCHTPAQEGGATPIADDREFFKHLDRDVRERFRRTQVMYVRNYGGGVDLPWQEVFGTTSRAEVEAYCRAGNLQCEWRADDRLRTRRIAPAIVPHPRHGTELWFNHAHLFHVSNLEPTLKESLLRELGEDDLPRNTYYGDGTPIEDSVMEHVRHAYGAAAIRFPWAPHDVLMADNMAVAHGRDAFVGERKTLVIMAESSLNHRSADGVSRAAVER